MNCRSMWIIKKLNASCDYGQPWSCLIEYQSSFSIKIIEKLFCLGLIGLLSPFLKKKEKSCFKSISKSFERGWNGPSKSLIQIRFKACFGFYTMENSAFPSFSFLLILKYLNWFFYSELGSEKWNGIGLCRATYDHFFKCFSIKSW